MTFKRFSAIGVLTASLGVGVWAAHNSRAADHRDSPTLEADPSTDINDVYTWTSTDNAKTYLAMTVSPFSGDDAEFSDAALYVFHVDSGAAFGATTASTDVICRFDADQTIHCWLDDEYLTGDASGAGVTSESGKLRVFAGLRDDPFFFNLDGFKATVQAVDDAVAAGGVDFNEEGCPLLDADTAGALVGQLQADVGGAPATDDFAGANILAIVVEADTDLLTSGGDFLAVWATTNELGN